MTRPCTVLLAAAILCGCASQAGQTPSSNAASSAEPRSDLGAHGTAIRTGDAPSVPGGGQESPRTDAPTNGQGPAGHPPTAEPGEPSLSAGTPVVRLLDAGQAPRQTLRYHIPAARSDTMTMDTTITMEMSMNGAPGKAAPPVAMRMKSQVDAAPAPIPGQLDTSFRITAMDLLPAAGAPPGPNDALMRSQLAPLVGLSGSGRMTARGQMLEMTMQIPPGLPPGMDQTLSGVRDNMKQLSTPLPLEAVGAGARWDIERTSELNGISMKMVQHFQVRALTQRGAILDVTGELTAPRQTLKPAGGATTTVESMQGTTTGSMELDLGRVVPGHSKMQSQMTSVMKIDAGGQTMSVDMKVRYDLDIHP